MTASLYHSGSAAGACSAWGAAFALARLRTSGTFTAAPAMELLCLRLNCSSAGQDSGRSSRRGHEHRIPPPLVGGGRGRGNYEHLASACEAFAPRYDGRGAEAVVEV